MTYQTDFEESKVSIVVAISEKVKEFHLDVTNEDIAKLSKIAYEEWTQKREVSFSNNEAYAYPEAYVYSDFDILSNLKKIKETTTALVDFKVSIFLGEDQNVQDMTDEEIIDRAVEIYNSGEFGDIHLYHEDAFFITRRKEEKDIPVKKSHKYIRNSKLLDSLISVLEGLHPNSDIQYTDIMSEVKMNGYILDAEETAEEVLVEYGLKDSFQEVKEDNSYLSSFDDYFDYSNLDDVLNLLWESLVDKMYYEIDLEQFDYVHEALAHLKKLKGDHIYG